MLTLLKLTILAMDAAPDERERLCYKRIMDGVELVLVMCAGPGCLLGGTSMLLINDSSGGNWFCYECDSEWQSIAEQRLAKVVV